MNLILSLQLTIALMRADAFRVSEVSELKEENIIDEKPFYPFNTVGAAAVPIIRPDNTTKSRIPDDTLLREGPEEFEVGFDSLINHLQDIPPLPTGHKVSPSDVGNLHPDEVFYADDDLLIIKGGGFASPPYTEPDQSPEPEEEFNFNAISSLPPNPHEEYNGNVPTIVRPPSKNRQFAPVSPTFYPGLSPLALFLPAQMLGVDNEPHFYYVPVQYEVRPVMPSLLWILLHRGMPIYQTPRPALSFIGDTNVNFVNPRPEINPDAESIVLHKPSIKSQKHIRTHRRTKPRL